MLAIRMKFLQSVWVLKSASKANSLSDVLSSLERGQNSQSDFETICVLLWSLG